MKSTVPRGSAQAHETSVPRSGSVSLKRRVESANRWRENYNPLRGLILARVVCLLEAGERGEMADLQWLYRFIEKRFPTLRGLIKRWRGALSKLDWDIKVKSELPEGATDAMAETQRKTLRDAYERVDNLRKAIQFLAHAEFRGYALLNKHRDQGGENDGAVTHLEPIDQWNWVKDGLNCEFYYNKDAVQSGPQYFKSRGDQPIAQGHPDFLVADEEMPVNEIAVVLFLRSNLCDKDWDAFIELFGIERPNVIGPPNVPKDKEDEYLAAAERIANGEGGYLPNGSDVKYPGQRGQGGAPFKERLDYIQEQLVLAGTGGLLTMLAKPTGMGSGVSEEHGDGFDDVALTKAREISEIFQQQFDPEVLELHHAGEPVCVYFQLGGEDEEDAGTILDNAVKAKQAGFKADAEELSEKTGLKLEDAPEPQSPISNQQSSILNRAGTSEFLSAIRADLKPFLARLDAVLGITDDTLREEKLRAWLADFDTMKADLMADPESARVLETVMKANFARGIANHES